jgi:hypothetical protein
MKFKDLEHNNKLEDVHDSSPVLGLKLHCENYLNNYIIKYFRCLDSINTGIMEKNVIQVTSIGDRPKSLRM